MNFIIAIIMGAIAGWIAEKIMKSDMGLLMNIILGIVGSFVGNLILQFLGFGDPDEWWMQLIVAVIGACLLIFIWRAVAGGRRSRV